MTMQLVCRVTLLMGLLAFTEQASAALHPNRHRAVAKRAAVEGDCPAGYEPKPVERWLGFGNSKGDLIIKEGDTPRFLDTGDLWGPPLRSKFSVRTQDFPGIVNSAAFTNDTSNEVIPVPTTYRIDMEIAPGQFHVPLWGKDGKLLVQDESVIVEPLGDTERVESLTLDKYAFTYPDYKPREMTDYQLDWQAGTITWTIGGKERVRITRKNADSDFPTGPLALRFGIWAHGWTGQVDWNAHPEVWFMNDGYHIEGCQWNNF